MDIICFLKITWLSFYHSEVMFAWMQLVLMEVGLLQVFGFFHNSHLKLWKKEGNRQKWVDPAWGHKNYWHNRLPVIKNETSTWHPVTYLHKSRHPINSFTGLKDSDWMILIAFTTVFITLINQMSLTACYWYEESYNLIFWATCGFDNPWTTHNEIYEHYCKYECFKPGLMLQLDQFSHPAVRKEITWI